MRQRLSSKFIEFKPLSGEDIYQDFFYDGKLQNEEVTKQQNKDVQKSLNYWLLENMKIMEKLTIKEPVSWSEQDWGG